MMVTWTAFLEGESERAIAAYFRESMKSIAEVDAEMASRKMKFKCH